MGNQNAWMEEYMEKWELVRNVMGRGFKKDVSRTIS